MRTGWLLAASLLTVGVAARQPNVVLILADDLGYGELGAYGQTKIKTPHLDQLARDGMRMTDFYSANPVCAPTRCSLLTGKDMGHAAVRGNKEDGGWGLNMGEGQYSLPAEEVTLAERLKAAGYATGGFGKWGLGGPGKEGHPLNQGFDDFFGYNCQRVAHNYYPTHLWDGHEVHILEKNRYFNPHTRLEELPATTSVFERFIGEQYAPDVMEEQALEFIDEHKDEPFFLYFPSPIPHASLQVTQPWIDMYPREWDPVPYLGQQGYTPCLRPRATYAGMISYLDNSVGKLLAKLDEYGLTEDTIVIFTSDNGATFNGGVDKEFFASNGNLRGHKTQVWEGGIRVPMIAKWPGRIAPGTTNSTPGASYDLFATVLDMVELEPQSATQGVSFKAILTGSGSLPERAMYWEHPESGGWQAVRQGNWKAIRPNIRQNGLTTQLYDLSADPSESKNVAADHPDLVSKMEGLMGSMRVPNPVFPVPGLDN